jgi:hypothetical protein
MTKKAQRRGIAYPVLNRTYCTTDANGDAQR